MSATGQAPDGAHSAQRLQDAGRELKDVAAAADDAVSGAASDVSHHADDTAEAAQERGEDLAAVARERAEQVGERAKDAGVAQGWGLARAIRHAADDLEESSPAIAGHVRATAESVEGVAEALRSQSVGDLIGKAGAFAQRQPIAFFGAAMLAGFAAVRFATSSNVSARRSNLGGRGDER
jgi:hypothetical protein